MAEEEKSAGEAEKQEAEKQGREEDFETRLKYLAAEFDNFRKRAAKERKDAGQSAVEKIVAELLPVLDDFDATLKTLEESHADAKVVEGIRLVRKNLLKILEAKGLERIGAAGARFDVGLHEAAGFEETGTAEEGTIVREVQAGYAVGGTVVRHAKVIVARKNDKKEIASN